MSAVGCGLWKPGVGRRLEIAEERKYLVRVTGMSPYKTEWGTSTDMRRSHAQELLNKTTYTDRASVQDHIKMLCTRKAAVNNLSAVSSSAPYHPLPLVGCARLICTFGLCASGLCPLFGVSKYMALRYKSSLVVRLV